MPIDSHEVLWFFGRLLLGGYFAEAGVHHFFALSGITQALAARGIPAPRLVLVAGSVFQIVAGLALIAGVQTLWAAVGLIVFTLMASAMLVNFWDMEGPARTGAIGTWKTNLALIGGLLIAAAHSL